MLKQNPGALDISLFFIGLMFFLPFIIMRHALPIPSFYTEWFAALSGFIAILPLLRTTIWRSIQIPQISLVFLGLATILIMQWVLGMLQSTQFFLLLLSYLIWAFFLTTLGNYLRHELGWERLITTLAWSLIAAGIVNFIILALQLLVKSGGIVPFLPNLVSFGAVSQPNHLANFDALAIASLIYLYAKKRCSQSFFILLLLLFIIILSFSGSRSAWLYLSAFAILAITLHINAIKQDASDEAYRRVLGAGLLVLPAFAFVQIIIHHVIPNQYVSLPTERLMDSVNVQTPSARLHIWYDSLRIFIQSPWLGIGMGQIREGAFSLLSHPSAMASNIVFEHAHNLFLHLLTEMGVFATLFVFIGLIIWIRSFKWHKLNLETWWLISLLVVIGIHSMLEYPLWFTYFLGITAVLLGAGDEKYFAINFHPRVHKFCDAFHKKISAITLKLILLFGAINLCTLFIANLMLEKWVQNYATGGMVNKTDIEWVSQYSLLSPYSNLLNAITLIGDSTMQIDQKLKQNSAAMRFKPMRKIVYQQALLLDLQGLHNLAIRQLNMALIAYPDFYMTFPETLPLKAKEQYLRLLSEVHPELKNTIKKND